SSAALAVAIDGTSRIPANTFPSIFLDGQVCIPFPGRDWLCAEHPFRPVACAADDIFDETLLQFGFWRQQLRFGSRRRSPTGGRASVVWLILLSAEAQAVVRSCTLARDTEHHVAKPTTA